MDIRQTLSGLAAVVVLALPVYSGAQAVSERADDGGEYGHRTAGWTVPDLTGYELSPRSNHFDVCSQVGGAETLGRMYFRPGTTERVVVLSINDQVFAYTMQDAGGGRSTVEDLDGDSVFEQRLQHDADLRCPDRLSDGQRL